MSKFEKSSMNTKLIHAGICGDEKTGSVNVPIYQTSTFAQEIPGVHKGYEYTRTGNPTREALEALIAELEGGVAGFAFASGLAAITAVLSLFQTGDTLVVSNNVYGGTFRLFDRVFRKFGIGFKLTDTTDLAAVERALDPTVKAVYIETPTNPLLDITDLRAVSEAAKKKGILTIVDNTFYTPYLQRPIEYGADIVIHSATKYLGGHSDLIAGLVVTKDKTLAEQIGFLQNASGGVLPPFDSFLLIRGIKTLGVRMDRHVQNAEILADFLAEHPAVEKVYYPGRKEHLGYEINAKQAKNGGAMISFALKKGADILEFFRRLRIITLAESLGGVESLVCHPASMTHAAIPKEIREKTGISEELIRLSVGIEDAGELKEDLRQAIEVAAEGRRKK